MYEIFYPRVSDTGGQMRVTEIATGRLKYEMMEPMTTYIVDQGGVALFVRVGKNSSKETKLQNLKVAVNYLRSKKYPDYTQVTMVTQGSEMALFKQLFVDWPQKSLLEQRTYTSGRGIGGFHLLFIIISSMY